MASTALQPQGQGQATHMRSISAHMAPVRHAELVKGSASGGCESGASVQGTPQTQQPPTGSGLLPFGTIILPANHTLPAGSFVLSNGTSPGGSLRLAPSAQLPGEVPTQLPTQLPTGSAVISFVKPLVSFSSASAGRRSSHVGAPRTAHRPLSCFIQPHQPPVSQASAQLPAQPSTLQQHSSQDVDYGAQRNGSRLVGSAVECESECCLREGSAQLALKGSNGTFGDGAPVEGNEMSMAASEGTSMQGTTALLRTVYNHAFS